VKNRENERPIEDGFTQIIERVRHGFELAAVFRDGKVSLHEVTEFNVEDECVGLLVAEELVFNGEPDVMW
jgi:hypothetical protein